jgi:putative SOS response-associated peptidase YedK
MCYFNSVHLAEAGIVYLNGQALSVPPEGQSIPLGNGFAYGEWPVVSWLNAQQGPQVQMAHWEFVPDWIKRHADLEGFRKKYNTLNAKAETVLSGKMFRQAVLQSPCLVLSSGFFEWRHVQGEGQSKPSAYPYYIHAPAAPFFFMAGIQRDWVDLETGECVTCFAILTRPANALMTQVHNTKKRMPLVLPQSQAGAWLNPQKCEGEIQSLLETAIPEDFLTAYPVRKDFRQWSNPEQRESYAELPPLALIP